MSQEYIETVVLDDPLGEARKPLPATVIAAPVNDSAESAQADDEYRDVPGRYSWLS